MNNSEQLVLDAARESNINFELIEGKKFESFLKSVIDRYGGIWSFYPMNCAVELTESVQSFSIDDLSDCYDYLGRFVGSRSLANIVEPSGDGRPTAMFVFESLLDSFNCMMNMNKPVTMIDRHLDFMIVENSHNQTIGCGDAAEWIRNYKNLYNK